MSTIFTIESKLHPWQQNKSKETVIAPKDICANDTRRVKLSKILAAIFEWAVLSSLPYNRFTIIYAINIFPPNSGTTLFLLPTLKRINFIRKESLIANRSFRELFRGRISAINQSVSAPNRRTVALIRDESKREPARFRRNITVKCIRVYRFAVSISKYNIRFIFARL